MVFPRDINIAAFPYSLPTVGKVPIRKIRIKIAAFEDMQGNVQNIRIVVECMLNAIAMMHIPVQNENLSTLVREIILADSCRNRYVIEYTKA